MYKKEEIKLNSLKCDWYNTTFNNLRDGYQVEVEFLHRMRGLLEKMVYPLSVLFVESGRGWRGYPLSGQFLLFDESTGESLGVIALCGYGSARDDMGVFVSVSGQYAHEYREAVLLEADNDPLFYHACSRVDVAFDWIELDSVDEVFSRFQAFAKRRNLKTQYQGDYDFKKDGRTYYIGSAKSKSCRIVLYEKGKEQIKKAGLKPSPDVENWLRVEVRLSGAYGRRDKIPNMNLNDIFFATKTVRALISECLPSFDFSQLKSDRLSVDYSANDKNASSSFAHMLRTYKNVMREVLTEDYEGDKLKFINRILTAIGVECI